MVLVPDALSHCALEVYEVSTKQCSTYIVDTTLHLIMLQGGMI